MFILLGNILLQTVLYMNKTKYYYFNVLKTLVHFGFATFTTYFSFIRKYRIFQSKHYQFTSNGLHLIIRKYWTFQNNHYHFSSKRLTSHSSENNGFSRINTDILQVNGLHFIYQEISNFLETSTISFHRKAYYFSQPILMNSPT